ncbi:MAG: radical SAM protein [Elusimicrobiota bacterium]
MLHPNDAIRVYELLVGYACNAKCLFCSQEFAWRGLPALTFEQMASKVYQAYREGTRVLVIDGGEPTVHPDLPKLVAFSRRAGFREIHIQTNGIRFGDRAYADALTEVGLNLARISIHAHTPELHDALLMAPGAFRKALAGIENLRRRGAHVAANILVNRMNYRTLPDYFRFFYDEIGLRDFGIIFPLYEGDMAVNAGRIGVRMSEAAPYVRESFELFRERGAEPPFLLNFIPCGVPGYESRMLRWSGDSAGIYDFEKKLLFDPERYTLEHPTGLKAGLDAVARKNKVMIGACRGCAYSERCLGCEKDYAERFGGSEFTAFKREPEPFDGGWGAEAGRWRRILTPEEHRSLREKRAAERA